MVRKNSYVFYRSKLGREGNLSAGAVLIVQFTKTALFYFIFKGTTVVFDHNVLMLHLKFSSKIMFSFL